MSDTHQGCRPITVGQATLGSGSQPPTQNPLVGFFVVLKVHPREQQMRSHPCYIKTTQAWMPLAQEVNVI
jgi:hypothetical protein